MKRTLVPVWLSVGLLAFASAFATEKVVIETDDDYPPYSFVEGGRATGIYVDFIRLVSESLAPDYEVTIKAVPWKRALANLENGDSLAMMPPYMNSGRKFIEAYSTPLFRESVVLFCSEEISKTHPRKFPDDFGGLLIGVNQGFALGEKMVAAVKAGKVKVEEGKGNDSNLRKLAAGRISCYANDLLSVRFSASKLVNDPNFRGTVLQEAVKLSEEDAYVAFGAAHKASFKSDFQAKLNLAIENGVKSGALAQIIARYAR